MQHKQNRGCTSMPSFYHTHAHSMDWEDDSYVYAMKAWHVFITDGRVS